MVNSNASTPKSAGARTWGSVGATRPLAPTLFFAAVTAHLRHARYRQSQCAPTAEGASGPFHARFSRCERAFPTSIARAEAVRIRLRTDVPVPRHARARRTIAVPHVVK